MTIHVRIDIAHYGIPDQLHSCMLPMSFCGNSCSLRAVEGRCNARHRKSAQWYEFSCCAGRLICAYVIVLLRITIKSLAQPAAEEGRQEADVIERRTLTTVTGKV